MAVDVNCSIAPAIMKGTKTSVLSFPQPNFRDMVNKSSRYQICYARGAKYLVLTCGPELVREVPSVLESVIHLDWIGFISIFHMHI